MSNTRDPQMRRLARAARVAGRNGQMTPRTHYLTPAELQGVPASRLVRETAFAERPDATPEWQDDRRRVVGEEFERRGFPEAANQVRAAWNETDYAQARAEAAESQAQQAAREAEYQRERAEAARETEPNRAADVRPSVAELGVIAASASVLASIGSELPAERADTVMQTETSRLDMAWSDVASDPAIGGRVDMTPGGVEADIADSLAAASSAPSFDAPAASPSPQMDISSPEAEL